MELRDIVFEGGYRLPFIDLDCEITDNNCSGIPDALTIPDSIDLDGIDIATRLPHRLRRFYKTRSAGRSDLGDGSVQAFPSDHIILCCTINADEYDGRESGDWEAILGEAERYLPDSIDYPWYEAWADNIDRYNADGIRMVLPWRIRSRLDYATSLWYDEPPEYWWMMGGTGYQYMIRTRAPGISACGYAYFRACTTRPLTSGTWMLVRPNETPYTDPSYQSGCPFMIGNRQVPTYAPATSIRIYPIQSSASGALTFSDRTAQIIASALTESSEDHIPWERTPELDPIGIFNGQAGIVSGYTEHHMRRPCPSRDYISTGGLPIDRVCARHITDANTTLSDTPGTYMIIISGYIEGYMIAVDGSARHEITLSITGCDQCVQYVTSYACGKMPLDRVIMIAPNVDRLELHVQAPGPLHLTARAYKCGV